MRTPNSYVIFRQVSLAFHFANSHRYMRVVDLIRELDDPNAAKAADKLIEIRTQMVQQHARLAKAVRPHSRKAAEDAHASLVTIHHVINSMLPPPQGEMGQWFWQTVEARIDQFEQLLDDMTAAKATA